MADTVINSDAFAFPQDEGHPNIADGNESWDSSGHLMMLAQAVDSGSYARSNSELTFTNHDGTNDTVDVTAGIAYLDLSGETVGVQTTYGGSSPPSYANNLPTLPSIMIEVFATVGSFSVQSATLSDVWLAYATDGTVTGVSAGDIYIRSDDTGSVTAPPHPNVKLGQANPDDSTADLLENRGSDITQVTTIDDTDSPYTTQGEDVIFVDEGSANVTVTLSTNDLNNKTRPTVIQARSGANSAFIETEGSANIEPGGNSQVNISGANEPSQLWVWPDGARSAWRSTLSLFVQTITSAGPTITLDGVATIPGTNNLDTLGQSGDIWGSVFTSTLDGDGSAVAMADDLVPETDGTQALGSSGAAYSAVHSGKLTNNGSVIDLDDILNRLDVSKGATTTIARAIDTTDSGGGRVSVQATDDVSTSATEIWVDPGIGAGIVAVWGDEQGSTDRFSELVHWHRTTGPSVVSTIEAGTPDGRTYSRSSGTLDLAMAANTYDIAVAVLSSTRDTNATS